MTNVKAPPAANRGFVVAVLGAGTAVATVAVLAVFAAVAMLSALAFMGFSGMV